MNPYDPTIANTDLTTNSVPHRTPRTAWAIALTPIVWAIVYSLLIGGGIEDIRNRHPHARDMPFGYGIFALAFLLITIPVNYLAVAILFRPIVRFPYLRFGTDLIVLLCVAGLLAMTLAPLAVSSIPGLTPLQQDRDALTRPLVIASLVSAATFFGLTRDRVLAAPSKLLRALWTRAVRMRA